MKIIYCVSAAVLLLLLAGCATAKDNEISAIKIEPGRKSTTAENIEAGGKVAAGAWDRLGKAFNHESHE